MTLNKEYYKKIKIHNGLDKEIDSSREYPVMHKSFFMKGTYDFDGLDLSEYGWKRIHALTLQQKGKLEKDPEYIDYLETIVYSGPQGTAVMYLNYKTDNHNIDITLRNYSENNQEKIENLKLMLERSLEGKLDNVDPNSNLIEEVGEN
jgi:hypothetical protein